MRIIFAGTPQVAVPTLTALVEAGNQVVGVMTRPPARQGRGKTLVPSPVAVEAHRLGLPVIETSRPRDPEVQAAVAALAPDLGVVVAYGAILPPALLQTPASGWLNLHFSDLPRWRGAAPVQHAIRAGDSRTAICVFALEEGLDTGPVYARLEIGLDGSETTDSLLAHLADLGSAQVCQVVAQFGDGTAQAAAQQVGANGENITVAPRLTKDDAFVDFQSSCGEVDAQIRSVTSNPGAWTTIEGVGPLKLGPVRPLSEAESSGAGRIRADKHHVQVGCGTGAVELGMVAPAGKNWMDAASWWRGARLSEQTTLGGPRG